MPPPYSADDYDAHGLLRMPLPFWALLLLQARTWLLFVMAGASRQQGSELLSLFYPDTQRFWIGIALGLPAALALILMGYRQRWPRLWAAWRWLLIFTVTLAFAQQILTFWRGESEQPPVDMLLAVLDTLCLFYLLFNARLIAGFHTLRL